MFWLGVKVLYFRQIFGFKHRLVMSGFSVLLPILFAFAIRLLWPSDSLTNVKVLEYLYNESFLEDPLFGFPLSLTVIVMPKNKHTSSLMTKAQSVLRHGNSSGLELHLRFAQSPEDLNRSLADSAWPSIGVEFHNATKSQLKYTLRPVADSNPENSAGDVHDDISPYSLLLQAAIDEAYIQTYIPSRGSLPKLLNFGEESGSFDRDGKRKISAPALKAILRIATFFSHWCVIFGMLTLIIFLASYTIRDKSNGVRELLCINGLPRWMVNTSWLFTFSLIAAIIAIVEMIIIKFPESKIPGITAPVLLAYLIVYHWTATFSVYLVANIFTSSPSSFLLIIFYYVFITFFIWALANSVLYDGYFVAQALLSLVPNVGSIFFCVAAVDSYVEFDKDLTLTNMFSKPEKFISPGLVLVMMLLGVIPLLGLGLYFDAVKPGPYGRARPWYLFTREEELTTDRWLEPETPSEALFREPIKDGVPIGLECVNIVKKFGTHNALNKVNLSIVKNSITVLLGHNGAGKTTLFSILCGMFSPTSGHVFTDEYNVFENINTFRGVLGYCPQENLLMQELTVHEHLIVFGLLKGLTLSEAAEYSDKWTQRFDMYTMRSTQAKKLSGGSKRKLCLAIAMTGDPEYLLLDEPSAGLDIESTKTFCDIILKEKGKCTVVITTHNMDEAELLGEHIAILAHGELSCYGSLSFLKKMLDTGYRLNCSLVSDMKAEKAVKAVQKMIPGTTILFKTKHSITFGLPVGRTNDIPDLLHRLESQFGDKMSSTLSPSTLDDVFIKMHKDGGVKVTIEEMPSISEETIRRSGWHFIELIKKLAKSLLSSRMTRMIIFVILLPNIAMVINMALINRASYDPESSQRSLFSYSFSKGSQAILTRMLHDHYDHILDFVQLTPTWKGIAIREDGKNMNFTVDDLTKKYLFKYGSKVLFSIDSQSSDKQVSFSPDKSDHEVSKIYSALINALIQGNTSIITYNSPFMKQQTLNECPTHDGYLIVIQYLYLPTLPIAFLVASTNFLAMPLTERATVFKHLQLMTGLLPVVYWLANLAFDILIYIVSCVLTIIITASMDSNRIFLKTDVMLAFILILFLYGLSSITHSYVWSFSFGSRGWAILALLLVNILLPAFMNWVVFNVWFWPMIIKCINITMPYLVLFTSMKKLIYYAIKKNDCMNCPLAGHEEPCFYVIHNQLLEVLQPELITLAVQALVWFALLLFFDHGLGRKLKGGIDTICCGNIKVSDRAVDPNVALERKRVKRLVMNNDEDNQPELIVDSLGKQYNCGKTAVIDVTFTAERGECFGLVGVNGSGKTTTFGMLAALMGPTKGTAFIEGKWKLTGCEYNYLKRIGYCPQYNGLLKVLSGRTILTLFGRLYGVPIFQIDELVDKWVKALDMVEIQNKPCGQYSGGNKRKLSLAIALIGNAPVVLLDEPTAGVDPVVRRRIWEIISHRLEQNETIILTSHTMSECEAICDRLTIMVKGTMKCLDTIPMLKKTFGKRSILEVKFKPNSTIKEQDAVKSKILSEFSSYITLDDRMVTRLKFTLNTENSKMYALFATMLRIQTDYEIVEDFNLVEAPLEQVFMMFAKKKTDKKK